MVLCSVWASTEMTGISNIQRGLSLCPTPLRSLQWSPEGPWDLGWKAPWMVGHAVGHKGIFAACARMYLNSGSHCCGVWWGDVSEKGIRWRCGGKYQGVLVDTILQTDMPQPVSAGKAYRGRRNYRKNPALLFACFPRAWDCLSDMGLDL